MIKAPGNRGAAASGDRRSSPGRAIRLAVVLGALGMGGCATPKPAARPSPQQVARELFQADLAFARMSAEKGASAAWAQFTTLESVQLVPNGPPIHGTRAIAEAMAGPPGARLEWRPEHAEAALSGDLGWTWGYYEYRGPDPEGRLLVNRGKYVTIWRRQASGEWKVAADIGNSERR